MKKFFALLLALCMIFALCACGGGGAKTSDGPFAPDGPVTLIVAYKAGSGTDGPARILAQYAEKYIGQTVVVENVPGGSGSIGWSQLAAADPDGMTIGVMNLPNFNTTITEELGTYTTADFKAICNHVTETSIVIVRADDDRFADLNALVEYGKAHNGELKASTNGNHASNHLGAQLFAKSAGFAYIDIPQGGTADQLLSLRNKESDFTVVKIGDIAGQESAYKVLGIFSAERDSRFPDVPTLTELGYYDKWVGASRAIVAPAGVSDEVISFYEDALKKTMEDPDYIAAASSFDTNFLDHEATAALIDEQQAAAEAQTDEFWSFG
ncbi:MAG: tripartite tricarboxylate transporter substrate binding protein [Oscillospiraceae bacterium]|nr:tripartite tricarboxylate transporter substrate binding protein [Oscillospiraceae bacterium]